MPVLLLGGGALGVLSYWMGGAVESGERRTFVLKDRVNNGFASDTSTSLGFCLWLGSTAATTTEASPPAVAALGSAAGAGDLTGDQLCVVDGYVESVQRTFRAE